LAGLSDGEDVARRHFYSLYSEHIDRMDDERPPELGLHQRTDLDLLSRNANVHANVHATPSPQARQRRAEFMKAFGSGQHRYMEECLQRDRLPLPIVLQAPGGVVNLAHYRMGGEIAAALAVALAQRPDKITKVRKMPSWPRSWANVSLL
jgi:hypothetical protein